MVKKIGQRKFLLKRGYFESELDKMSPSEAKRIIADIEKIEHPQGQRKVYSEKEINAIKDFVEWYKAHLNDLLKYERDLYTFAKNNKHEDNAIFFEGEINMLKRLLGWIDRRPEQFLKEREIDND